MLSLVDKTVTHNTKTPLSVRTYNGVQTQVGALMLMRFLVPVGEFVSS